jgi:hypothetical protein
MRDGAMALPYRVEWPLRVSQEFGGAAEISASAVRESRSTAADVDAKPGVTAAQRKLLESRYDLQPKLDPSAKMSRGKPLAVGPTARLADGLSWDRLAAMSPDDGRAKKAFPRPCRIPSMRRAAWSSPRSRSRCSRACSAST